MAEQIGDKSSKPTDGSRVPGWGFWLRWVLASTVGWVLGGVAAVVADAVVVGLMVGFAVGGVIGGGPGVLQWLVLRRQVARAGWWVVASAVGVGVGWIVEGGVVVVVVLVVSEVLGGAVNGAITGAMLVWLLRQRAAAAATVADSA